MDRYDLCAALARDAGKHRAPRPSARRRRRMKGRHDVVTAMDREVERFIRAAIADALSGGRDHRRGGRRRPRRRGLWLDRPDRRHRQLRARHCRATACRSATSSTACRCSASIYDPSHDWLYRRRAGEGAWRDGERLAVSPCADLGARRPSSAAGRRGARRPTYVDSAGAGARTPAGRSAARAPARSGSPTSRPAAPRPTPSCTSTPGTARPASCWSARPAASPTISSPATAFAPAIR